MDIDMITNTLNDTDNANDVHKKTASECIRRIPNQTIEKIMALVVEFDLAVERLDTAHNPKPCQNVLGQKST